MGLPTGHVGCFPRTWAPRARWSSLASSATLSLVLRVGSRSRCRRVLEVLASAYLPASPRGDAGRRPSLIELLSRALTSCPDPRFPRISSPGVRPDAISRWARASSAPPSATVCVHSWTRLATTSVFGRYHLAESRSDLVVFHHLAGFLHTRGASSRPAADPGVRLVSLDLTTG